MIVPFKPTKISILGGERTIPHTLVTILDTLTMKSVASASQTDDATGVMQLGASAVVVNDRQAFHVVVVRHKNRRLIEITVGVDECVTFKTVGALV